MSGKRSLNAQMTEAAKGTLGRRPRNNRHLAALLEAEKGMVDDEVDNHAARAPQDNPAVVDFKKKLQEHHEAAGAAAARRAAEAQDKAVVDAAARAQHDAGLTKPNFSTWPVATTGAGEWIKVFEPAVAFEDERHFCCYLPGSHEYATLIKCTAVPTTTNFKDHISKYHTCLMIPHADGTAAIDSLFQSATARSVADDQKSAAIASLIASSTARKELIGLRFDCPAAARELTSPKASGSKMMQTQIDFTKSGTAQQQQAARAQLRWAFAQLSTRSSWRIVNDPLWRHAVDMGSKPPPPLSTLSTPPPAAAAAARRAVNEKVLRTKTLDRIYAFVWQRLCNEISAVPSFSIGYDVWTNRGLRGAFVGIMVFFVTADLQPRSALMAVAEITASHTAEHIARVVAAVLDEVTTEFQHIYGTQCDTAANVRAAAKLLLEDVGAASRLQVVDELESAVDGGGELEVVELAPGAVSDLFGNSNDNDDEADGGGGDDLDLAELGVLPDADLQPHEELRSQRCFEHVADLMTKDAVKAVAQLKEAVQLVDQLVAVFGRSEQRKRLLAKINGVIKPNAPARPMLRRVPTRWHVLPKCIRRLLENMDAINLMFDLGMFKGVSVATKALKKPSGYLLKDLAAVADLLELISAAGRPLEGSDYFTLPFVSVVSDHMIRRLAAEHPDERHDRPLITRTRVALLESAKRRLAPYLDANSPAMLACLLHPLTSRSFLAIGPGVDTEALKTSRNLLAEWYSELAQSAIDKKTAEDLAAAGGPPAKARRANEEPELAAAAVNERAAQQLRALAELERDVGNDNDARPPDEAEDAVQIAREREEARQKLKKEGTAAVTSLLKVLCRPDVVELFPFPDDLLNKTNDEARAERSRGQSSNAMAKVKNTVQTFYQGAEFIAAFPDPSQRARLIMLVRCVMSSPATNAGGEAAFSLAGLIDSPLRNRIEPTTFNKMVVASYEVIRLKNRDTTALEQFVEDCVRSYTL
jgi:hypothetical protein